MPSQLRNHFCCLECGPAALQLECQHTRPLLRQLPSQRLGARPPRGPQRGGAGAPFSTKILLLPLALRVPFGTATFGATSIAPFLSHILLWPLAFRATLASIVFVAPRIAPPLAAALTLGVLPAGTPELI